MIYLTGDTHGRFARVEDFCRRMMTEISVPKNMLDGMEL